MRLRGGGGGGRKFTNGGRAARGTRHHKHHRDPVSPKRRLSWSPACSPENEPAGPTPETPHGLGRAFWDKAGSQTKALPSAQGALVIEESCDKAQHLWENVELVMVVLLKLFM